MSFRNIASAWAEFTNVVCNLQWIFVDEFFYGIECTKNDRTWMLPISRIVVHSWRTLSRILQDLVTGFGWFCVHSFYSESFSTARQAKRTCRMLEGQGLHVNDGGRACGCLCLSALKRKVILELRKSWCRWGEISWMSWKENGWNSRWTAGITCGLLSVKRFMSMWCRICMHCISTTQCLIKLCRYHTLGSLKRGRERWKAWMWTWCFRSHVVVWELGW